MKFVADRMVGRLAKWLRILGYDVTFLENADLSFLMKLAQKQGRVILTRNRQLLKDAQGARVLLLESEIWKEQLAEVFRAFRLRPGRGLFQRCLLCNRRLLPLRRELAEGKIPDFIYAQNPAFSRCPQCSRIFWQGSHLSGMSHILSEILPSSQTSFRKESL